MKLRILAEAAEEFYKTPNLRSRRKHRNRSHPQYESAHRIKARHVCQWVACDAGYLRSIVGRFWGMERTSINYACQVVDNRIATDPEEKRELKRFVKIVKERLSK